MAKEALSRQAEVMAALVALLALRIQLERSCNGVTCCAQRVLIAADLRGGAGVAHLFSALVHCTTAAAAAAAKQRTLSIAVIQPGQRRRGLSLRGGRNSIL